MPRNSSLGSSPRSKRGGASPLRRSARMLGSAEDPKAEPSAAADRGDRSRFCDPSPSASPQLLSAVVRRRRQIYEFERFLG
jgi:hypothetical protein